MAPGAGAPRAHGEQNREGKVRAGTVSGRHFTAKPVRFTDVDGRAFFEGDILLGRTKEVAQAGRVKPPVARGAAIVGDAYRWPCAIVVFQVDPSLAKDDPRVRAAIEHWRTNTSLHFVERDATNRSAYPDYILLGAFDDACWSSVGRQGGEQLLSVGGGCTKGNVIHELAHSIGLWHEQSREDRDRYVTINLANIDPAMLHNFDQHITDGDDIGDYDYASIMHYPTDAFTRNGEPTIVAKQAGVTVGQREGLSAGDLQAVAKIYEVELARR
jgi:hypothetical protein